MKRTLSLFLVLLLLLSTVSCIQLKPAEEGSGTETSAETDPPTQTTTGTEDTDPSLPAWNDAQSVAKAFLLSDAKGTIVDCSEREYSYLEMQEDLARLAGLYPQIFSYHSFGKSAAGREMYVAVLGNPNASRQILVSAGIHGREYLTPLLVMKQLEFYLGYYNTGSCGGVSYATLFDNCCFYVVPMTNPDGIMLSQAGISTVSDQTLYNRIYAAYYKDFEEGYTQQTNINEYLKIWKANANGVDLNRNFDARWSELVTMDRVSHKNYKGESAASEPETRAMVELTESLPNLQAVLCIHSQGEVLYWNCGQSTALASATRSFTAMIARANGYYIVDERNNDASYSDWCALKKGLIAVTVETGVDACPLPISQFPTIWEDNFELFALSALYFEK